MRDLEKIEAINKALEQLEAAYKAMRAFDKKLDDVVEKHLSRQADIITSLFVALFLVLGIKFFVFDEILGDNHFQIFALMFGLGIALAWLGLLVHYILMKGWQANLLPLGQRHVRKFEIQSMQEERQGLLTQLKNALTDAKAYEGALDGTYLNSKSILYIKQSLESSEVASLDEAIELLRIELENPKAKNRVWEENLLQRSEALLGGESV